MYDYTVKIFNFCFQEKYIIFHYLGSFQRFLNMFDLCEGQLKGQNCPSLRLGQFRGTKCLAYVELSLENKPLDTYPTQKKSLTF